MADKHKQCCCGELRRLTWSMAVLAGALLMQGFALLGQGSGFPPPA